MKNLKYILTFLLLPILLFSCMDHNSNNNPQQGDIKENNYASSDAAVQKGKTDLLAMLQNKNLNLNIDHAALERSTPGMAVPVFEVNFERLLKAETDSLAGISVDSKKISNTLTDANKVVAVINTSKTDKGWRLDEVTNMELADNLNEIRGAINQPEMPLRVYEVPNLNATIFETTLDGRKMYFTKYKGQSLREPVPADQLMQMLRTDAQIFQRTYGEELKKGKLVK